ncbi:uncharacterized protein TRAVEDRAFT_42587 [Trametes versicolor FP-101664 SS1]|uniref:uncharacterized protein n=1 Tax=Trametes versicolor (strain FP-101664) TaxID=717944 RepID=UPI00046245B6|nr:uncharacterized protein TRAVEDRAFT_42587 [Trametes versicolor FP-101664 SS1]EIW65210.1 hypothetical protein TRAVEDRAFT_42587 [Trametes versicolor FP-101664 SS1]
MPLASRFGRLPSEFGNTVLRCPWTSDELPPTHFDLISDLDPSRSSVEDPVSPASLPPRLKAKSPVLLHGHALRQATGVNGKSGTCPDRNSRQPLTIHEWFLARPRVY